MEVTQMKSFKYVIYREGKYYVSQCLNVDIASCGDTIEEAINNLKDAVMLYFRCFNTASVRPVEV